MLNRLLIIFQTVVLVLSEIGMSLAGVPYCATLTLAAAYYQDGPLAFSTASFPCSGETSGWAHSG